MRKALTLLFVIYSISAVYGQNTTLQAQSSNTGTQVIDQQSGPNRESLEIISKAGVLFCNDGFEKEKMTKSLKLDIRPGEKKDLCLIFYNQNEFPIKVIPGVSVGTTKDGQYLCDQDNSPDNAMYETIQANRKNKEIELTSEKGKVLLRTGSIIAPKDGSGTINICFGITLVEKEKISGMFKLKHRRGYQIILNITGDVYNPGLVNNIQNHKNTILKILTGIIGIRLIVSIIQQTSKKKKKDNHKK